MRHLVSNRSKCFHIKEKAEKKNTAKLIILTSEKFKFNHPNRMNMCYSNSPKMMMKNSTLNRHLTMILKVEVCNSKSTILNRKVPIHLIVLSSVIPQKEVGNNYV